MKDPMEVLHAKEQQLIQVKREVEALRVVARLLSEDNVSSISEPKQDRPQLVEMP